MVFAVTPLYALPVAVVYLVLWFRVSSVRSEAQLSFGDGGNPVLLQRIRQHGNCAEWSGFVLILMMLAEGMGTPALWLHISGALLVIGRIAHPFGLVEGNAGHPLRYLGGTNLLAALAAIGGPFAETREHLGGYYIIDVPDLDAALRYAAQVPAALYGTVEIRPLMDYNPAG